MRRVIVSIVLLGLLGGVATMLAMREQPRVAEPEATEPAFTADVTVGEPKAEAPEGEPTPPEPESLRVVALGWELLAPGVQANGGLEPGASSRFRDAGLHVSFAPVVDAAEVEVRLSRGGADEHGADVALMPLPMFVASYERLRALSPQVFFVVAWSRGREALVGDATLLRAPARGTVWLEGTRGAPATLVGLFALDQAGVSAASVELVEGQPQGGRSLHAMERHRSGDVDARSIVLSTADATHLVPLVAVASASVVEHRRDALVRWSRAWMEGARALEADPAETARLLAAQKGAPEVVDLVDALGWLVFVDVRSAATAAGLSGRGAVTLDALFHRTWALWREVGVLTSPAPEHVPLTATVIADLASEVPADLAVEAHPAPVGDARVLLTRVTPGRRLDAPAEAVLVTEVGFLAGVFSRATVEVSVPLAPEAAARVALHAVERFGLPADRVVAGSQRDKKAKHAAVITVRVTR